MCRIHSIRNTYIAIIIVLEAMAFSNFKYSSSRYFRDSLRILEESLESTSKLPKDTTDDEVLNKRSQILSDLVPFLLLKKRVAWNEEDKMATRGKDNENTDGQTTKKRKRDNPINANEGGYDFAISSATSKEQEPYDKVGSRHSPSTSATTHHQIQLENLLKENRRLVKKRRQLREAHKNFINAYQYGLYQVSKLNDLTYVPDNIMKGNFPKTET